MYIFIILTIILSISSIYFFKEKKKEQKEKEKIEAEFQTRADQAVAEHLEKSKASIEQTLNALYEQKKNELEDAYNSEAAVVKEKGQALQIALQAQESHIAQLKQSSDQVLKEYKEKLDLDASNYKNNVINSISEKISDREVEEIERLKQATEIFFKDFDMKKDTLESELEGFMQAAAHRKEIAEKEIGEIQKTLDDFRAKRDVLNAEILRQRAIEEKEDFYKIQIDEASLHDMALLDEIKSQFSKFDLIQKLEYDNYVSKSAQEMVKRVLEGRKPSGIYKVTRLKTGEVYIGKSTDIASRWIQHCKSCYHCGTISHSTFHSTLEKDGIQNFTWELLEEVEKSKLTEREKYWIEFYDSKNYGMNEKVG